jgi:hypothetical protein
MIGAAAWRGLALALLALAVVPGDALATHGANVFSGTWNTVVSGTVGGVPFTQGGGSVSFSVVDATSGGTTLTGLGGTRCAEPTTYYSGPYSDGHNSGQMAGCVTGGQLVGRYQSPAGNGGISIAFSPPSQFAGTYTADNVPGFTGTYTGTFGSHLANDGCCPAPATPAPQQPSPVPVENPADDAGVSWGTGVTLCTSGLRAVVITSGCVARAPVTAEEKTEARKTLRDDLRVAVLFCGLYATLTKKGHRFANEDEDETGLPTGAVFQLCQGAVQIMSATLVTVQDPPDPRYRRLALPRRARAAAAASTRCPRRISRSACVAIVTAGATWTDAVSRSAAFARSWSQTVNRYAGAVQSGAADVAAVQGAFLKLLAIQQMVAFGEQAKAGAAYAAALRRARLNPRFPAKRLRGLASGSLNARVLKAATQDGVAGSRTAAKRKLSRQLARASGTLSLAQLASSTPPLDPLLAKARSLTIPDLAAIVTALSSDGAIAASTAQVLLRDLGAATVACRAGAGAGAGTALEQFARSVAAQGLGNAGGYLQAGAGVAATACG